MLMHHRSVLKLNFFLNNVLLDKAVEENILVCLSFFFSCLKSRICTSGSICKNFLFLNISC